MSGENTKAEFHLRLQKVQIEVETPFGWYARKSPIRRASTSASLQTEAESLSSLGASNQIKFLLQIKCSFLLQGIFLSLPMVGGLSH